MTVADAISTTGVGRLRPVVTLRGALEVPSDKSIAHRALICAALAAGKSRVVLRHPGGDVQSTIGALRSLGVEIAVADNGDEVVVSVDGRGEGASIAALGSGSVDCGNSGTSMRLLTGALAVGSGTVTLIGDESLSGRPMTRVADPLRQMGADVQLTEGHAPVVVRGLRPLRAIDFEQLIASAQVLGAISLAALAADGITTVRVPGRVRDHTERMLAALGADVQRALEPGGGVTTTVGGPHGLRPFEGRVPGDFSSAAAWIVAACVHPSAELRITNVGLNPTRTALLDVLQEMGAEIEATALVEEAGEPRGEIVVRGGGPLRAIELGARDVAPLIDEMPLLAVAMAAADGTSEVRGAAELRVKESDRIAALAAALTAAGARFEELPDGWRISRGRPTDVRVVTHSDHRIAMAMAVAAWTGVAARVELDDPSCVAVSYPSFWTDARSIGAIS